jgi:RNA polymerase sigma factor for flagellar operon FliA
MTATASDTAALIEAHLPLVRQVLSSVAGHFPRHADREELAQAARLGLVEAAHRYDAERGVPFERWAALRIRGAILDSVRAVDFAPRTLRSAMRQAEAARCELEGELHRTPTPREHADRMGVSVRELTTLEGKAHRALVISLDAGVDRAWYCWRTSSSRAMSEMPCSSCRSGCATSSPATSSTVRRPRASPTGSV